MMNKKEDLDFQETKISRQTNYNSTRLNRAKAIKQKCLECCCDIRSEVKNCQSVECSLWRYRTGREERDCLYYESHHRTGGKRQQSQP